MIDVRRIGKKFALQLRQYLGRVDVAERHLRGEGIEIGALQDPMPLPKGARVRYLDLAPTEELRRLYPRKSARHLVEVDIVDDGERMSKVASGSVDFVASNHFIEHTENPIGALENMLRVVRPGGVVFMSLPDKRLIFDRRRPPTTWEHLIADHHGGTEQSRRGHYEEVVRYNEHVEDPERFEARVEELMAQRFPIHFHAWDQGEFMQLLMSLQRELSLPFEVAEFRANELEMVWVLRKTEAPVGAP